MSLKVTETFEAKDDADNVYKLMVYENVAEVSPAESDSTGTSIAEIKDTAGGNVTRMSKGVYQLNNGITVRSNDPVAT